MKDKIIQTIISAPFIPVFNSSDIDESKSILNSCFEAGLKVFEFTNRSENAIIVFEELIQFTQQYTDFNLGIGTVLDLKTAKLFHKAGAHFIVSPIFSDEISSYCLQNNILYIPGCGTITEVYNSFSKGNTLVKVFPANVVGTEFIKATLSVIPEVKIMPTGGILPNKEDILLWKKAGACTVGMGSKIFNQNLINNKDYNQITNELKKLINQIS